MRGLVVDSNADVRALVGDVLHAAACYDVSFATTGEEALRSADQGEVDLIVLALELIDVDGIEILRRLASAHPSVPILAMSGRDDDVTIKSAVAAGAQDFITQPLRQGELEARVRLALRQRAERVRSVQREERLVAQSRRLEVTKNELERVICVDQLTGVANRRHFDNMLQLEWRRASRSGAAISVVMIDLDYFRGLNELYGHLGGDLRLKRVSDAMAHCLRRPSDLLARYGGEEFVALLPDTETTGACVVAERLRSTVEELGLPHEASKCSRVVTISAGVATWAAGPERDPEDLVGAADAALYRAKNEGRNRYCADVTPAASIVVRRQPWPVCPVAMVDPFLVQRIPTFLDSCTIEVQTSREAADRGDFARVRVMARGLREAAASYGIDALGELGSRIDDCAQQTNTAALGQVLDELSWYLTHVQVVYRQPPAARQVG